METIIKAEKVSKEFVIDNKKQVVLENIDIMVNKGEFVCIVGPSGCGKSTLLRIISQLIKASSGKVELAKNMKLSMVFQNFALFPWLTVEENICFGLRMKKYDSAKIKSISKQLIQEMGLVGMEEKHPKELSGGMKQRVGIARALAIDPNVLLLDEPFSALDIFTANKLRQDLLSIWKKSGLTILMVSHLIEEAIELADKVIILSSNPGRVRDIIEIKLSRPRNTRNQDFYSYVDKIEELIS